jgi:hypothetical protein
MKYIDLHIQKYQNGFSSKSWLLRILTLSIALGSVLYYLDQHHKGRNIFFNSEKAEANRLNNSVIRMKIPVGRSKN